MVPNRNQLPNHLTKRDQWLCWRAADRAGKQTKIPVDPTTGQTASATDPETWTSFETARLAVYDSSCTGLGFAFAPDGPLVGVDLDDCRDPETGVLADWAATIVDRLDSYTEVSPSGTGVHVLVEGLLPEGRNRRGDVEIYESNRFFTVTGDHLEGTPTKIHKRSEELEAVHASHLAESVEPQPEGPTTSVDGVDVEGSTGAVSLDDEALVRRARSAKNGAKFDRLWQGSTAGYESQSEADMALCTLLAFWTGGERNRIDSLFRQSGLLREKWDEVHYADGRTYGEVTVQRAIDITTEFYDPTESADDRDWPTRPDEHDSIPAANTADSTRESSPTAVGADADPLQECVVELTGELHDRTTEVEQLRRLIHEQEDEIAALREELRSRAHTEPVESTAQTRDSPSALSRALHRLRSAAPF